VRHGTEVISLAKKKPAKKPAKKEEKKY